MISLKVLLAVFLSLPLFAAAAEESRGTPRSCSAASAAVGDMDGLVASPVAVKAGNFPVGVPAEISLKLSGAATKQAATNGVLSFQVWAQSLAPASPPGVKAEPVDVPIGAVEYDAAQAGVTLDLLMQRREFPVRWREDYRFTVIACDLEGEAFRAVFDKRVTSQSLGFAWAGGLGVVALGAILFFVSSRAKREEIPWATSFALLFADFRDKVSLTRVQVTIFTLVVALSVTYAFALTGLLTSLSGDVLKLLGIAAGSATIGNIGDTHRQRLGWDSWIWLKSTAKAIDKSKAFEKLSLSQAITSNGRFDIFRFQALLFTVIVSMTLLSSALGGLSDLTIPDSILGVLGLSQVTYLAGKFVAPPTVADFEADLKKFRDELAGTPPPEADRYRQIRDGFESVFGYPPQGELLSPPGQTP